MALTFNNSPVAWLATGAEPTNEFLINGFTAGYKPPAEYFNFVFNRTYLAINELQNKLPEYAKSEIVQYGRASFDTEGVQITFPTPFQSTPTVIAQYVNGFAEAVGDPYTQSECIELNTQFGVPWKNESGMVIKGVSTTGFFACAFQFGSDLTLKSKGVFDWIAIASKP